MVPEFVYEAFYPDCWQARQIAGLGQILDGEPETGDVASVNGVVAEWVCTRIHPADAIGEVYVIAPTSSAKGGQALTAEERSPLSGSRRPLNMQLTPLAASRSSNTPPLRGAGTCTVSRV